LVILPRVHGPSDTSNTVPHSRAANAMTSFRALALLGLAPAATGLGLQVSDALHNLTICNAYAESKPLSIYTVNNKAKLTEEPLQYKHCKDIVLDLQEGERIDFRLGGLSVGTFHATHLPFVASSLVLVPYKKKGNGSLSATFASHTFGPVSSDKAQVAVIDAYNGDQQGTMNIKVAGRHNDRLGSAELKPGSAVTLAEGTYDVSLTNTAEQSVQTVKMHVAGGTNSVVLRLGSDELSQEIIVKHPPGWVGSDEMGDAGWVKSHCRDGVCQTLPFHDNAGGAFQSGLGLVSVAAAAAALLSA